MEDNKSISFIKALVFADLLILLLFCSCTFTSSAQTIKGSTALGGYSKDLSNFFDSGHELYKKEDLNLLAEVMFHENGSNSDKCILYTGSVVLNRVHDKEFPNSIHDVLYQKGQYSTTKLFFTKPIPKHIYELAKELLIFGSQLDEAYLFQAMFVQTKEYIKVDTEYFCKARR